MEFENYFFQTIDLLIKFWHFLQKPASAAFGTGLGIILGNTIINLSKYSNYLKDISKIFDLIINNQLDDLYNIRLACSNINNRITTHYTTIVGINDTDTIIFDIQRIEQERRELLQYIARLKDLTATIKDDDLYNQKLGEVKSFQGDKLEKIVRYFRKLKVLIGDLQTFTLYELPGNIEEIEKYNWKPIDFYKNRINFLVCRINIVTCLGLIAKESVKQFNDKAKKDLLKTFQETYIVTDAVENSNSLYVLLKEDYEIISNFIQKINYS